MSRAVNASEAVAKEARLLAQLSLKAMVRISAGASAAKGYAQQAKAAHEAAQFWAEKAVLLARCSSTDEVEETHKVTKDGCASARTSALKAAKEAGYAVAIDNSVKSQADLLSELLGSYGRIPK